MASMRLDAQDEKYLAERQLQRERRRPISRQQTRAYLRAVASSHDEIPEPADARRMAPFVFGQEVTP